jgi:hypothetical protein
MDPSDRVRSDLHLERCGKSVRELEKAAVERARKGQFVQVIDAVEENISVRCCRCVIQFHTTLQRYDDDNS